MKINLESLETERINKNTRHIDMMSTIDMLKVINKEDQKVSIAISAIIEDIGKAVDEICERLKVGGRLIYIGAGTSGRLGVLDASECPPTYGVNPTLIQGIMAGGDRAIRNASEGAEDDETLAITDLCKVGLNTLDVLCGLTASGRTPYVKSALCYAKKMGALTLSICCVQHGEISKESDIHLEVPVGPEVVSGSTRMKAGTAQKMILNMLSTSVMIKLGKVYGNFMVDVKATNEKLVERAKRMIMLATNCSYTQAVQLFEASGKHVKVAIVMHKCHLTKAQSEQMLSEHEENISSVIEKIGGIDDGRNGNDRI